MTLGGLYIPGHLLRLKGKAAPLSKGRPLRKPQVQVVQSKAHTAWRRDVRGSGQSMSESRGEAIIPWGSAETAGAGSRRLRSHTGGRVKRLRIVFEITTGLPYKSSQYQAFRGTSGFSWQGSRPFFQNCISPPHTTPSCSLYCLLFSFF